MPNDVNPAVPTAAPVTPTPINNARRAGDTFSHTAWRVVKWVAIIVAIGAGLGLVLWMIFRAPAATAATGGEILPIAFFLMLMAVGAIVALAVGFLTNRRSISAGRVIGVVGAILAIMFVFALIAYNFPGFGRAIGFATPTPAATTTGSIADPNTPPAPPAKKIEKTTWERKEVFKFNHLPPHKSVTDFKPPQNARNCEWEGVGYWCAGNIGTTTGCSGNWHGIPEETEKRSGECFPNPGEPYPISTGSFPVDDFVITMEVPRMETVDNPEYFAHCAKYNNCPADPAS